jgi:hypothetical protein
MQGCEVVKVLAALVPKYESLLRLECLGWRIMSFDGAAVDDEQVQPAVETTG